MTNEEREVKIRQNLAKYGLKSSEIKALRLPKAHTTKKNVLSID